MYPLWKLIVVAIFSFFLGSYLTALAVAFWQLYKLEQQSKKDEEVRKAEIQRLKEENDKRIEQLLIDEEIFEELEKYPHDDGNDYPC